MTEPPHQPNIIGNASLILSILSLSLVFGIGMCALAGVTQKWIQLAGAPLFVCGASSAFLGFLGVVLGVAGLIGGVRSRATAVVGLLLGLSGVCLFFIILALLGKGG